MKKTALKQYTESYPQPRFLRDLSPQMIKLLEQHFWCDFSDVIPALSWEQDKAPN
jgi:hypothetical protein